jgi:CheY-like chemotaxis protein
VLSLKKVEGNNLPKNSQKILIIDDDIGTLDIFSSILKEKGFLVETATTAQKALSKTANDTFDLFLIDIKLPDIDGTKLLEQLQKNNPESIKIMMTGNPSTENAITALNIGANSFLTKPFEVETLLENINLRLQEREQKEQRLTGKKLDQWIKLKINKVQSNEYSKFAEEIADMLVGFGINRTQAKLYTALNALGAATVSEIASLSKIRREEIYRILPELEKRGLVIGKLEVPRKFVATDPKTVTEILIKAKISSMEKEIAMLGGKKDELVSRLEKTSFGLYEENSVEALSRNDNIEMRIDHMIQKAKTSILCVGNVEELEQIIAGRAKVNAEALEATSSQVSLRSIVSQSEIEHQYLDFSKVFKQISVAVQKTNCSLELNQIEKLPFNLIIIDKKEAIWWNITQEQHDSRCLWTNDATQIEILRRAFESLWQETQPYD